MYRRSKCQETWGGDLLVGESRMHGRGLAAAMWFLIGAGAGVALYARFSHPNEHGNEAPPALLRDDRTAPAAPLRDAQRATAVKAERVLVSSGGGEAKADGSEENSTLDAEQQARILEGEVLRLGALVRGHSRRLQQAHELFARNDLRYGWLYERWAPYFLDAFLATSDPVGVLRLVDYSLQVTGAYDACAESGRTMFYLEGKDGGAWVKVTGNGTEFSMTFHFPEIYQDKIPLITSSEVSILYHQDKGWSISLGGDYFLSQQGSQYSCEMSWDDDLSESYTAPDLFGGGRPLAPSEVQGMHNILELIHGRTTRYLGPNEK